MREDADKPTRVAVVANTGWYLYNFRRKLMLALKARGHEVIAISPPDEYSARFATDGIAHAPWVLSATGKNPVVELRAVAALRRLLERAGATVVLSYTPKGNIYSGLACVGSRRTLLPNVSGLGRIFSDGGPLATLVQRLYRLAMSRAPRVFFQNEEDRDQFARAGIVQPSCTERLMGSGVDLERFSLQPLPSASAGSGDRVTFLLVARMIREKGIPEYVAAARALRTRWPHARFQLLGALEQSRGLTAAEIDAWVREGAVEYLGTTDDVPAAIAAVDALVLPSYYREGVPRSLIEGAAMGRPIITTDMPGCRDVVEPGVNGWLCTPRDVEGLAQAMANYLAMSPPERAAMGERGRERAVRLFDERAIIASYLDALDALSVR